MCQLFGVFTNCVMQLPANNAIGMSSSGTYCLQNHAQSWTECPTISTSPTYLAPDMNVGLCLQMLARLGCGEDLMLWELKQKASHRPRTTGSRQSFCHQLCLSCLPSGAYREQLPDNMKDNVAFAFDLGTTNATIWDVTAYKSSTAPRRVS